MNLWNKLLILLAEDGSGGAVATPDTPPPDGQPTPEPPPAQPDQPQHPKYWTQISKETQEKYGKLADKLPEKLDGLIDTFADVYNTDQEGRLIRVPPKDATEEQIKAFYQKMGIPESPDGYEWKSESGTINEELTKALGERVHQMGLTKQQGQKVLGMLDEIVGGAVKQFNSNLAEAEKTFEDRLLHSLGDDKQATEETMNLFKHHILSRYGNEDVVTKMRNAGLLTDPQFVKAMADVERKMTPPAPIDGDTPDGPPKQTEQRGTFGGNYSKEFASMYPGAAR